MEIVEHNELIATRTPPGDNWILTNDSKREIHNSLTDTLEAYFYKTGFKGEYRLSPLNSKIYAIQTHEEETVKPETKTYSFYGEFKQGV